MEKSQGDAKAQNLWTPLPSFCLFCLPRGASRAALEAVIDTGITAIDRISIQLVRVEDMEATFLIIVHEVALLGR